MADSPNKGEGTVHNNEEENKSILKDTTEGFDHGDDEVEIDGDGEGPKDFSGDDEYAAEEEENEEEREEREAEKRLKEQDLSQGIAANDVKNIILQVLSPYLDDDVVTSGGAGDPVVDGTNAGAAGADDTAQRYDHGKSNMWIQLICDSLVERLIALQKPYKYVTHVVIMRRTGAGLHVCSSCFYGQSDGWVSHAHDLSAHIYAVVTVYWSSI